MELNGRDVLLKKVTVKKRGLRPFARWKTPGEPAYDYATAAASRERRPALRRKSVEIQQMSGAFVHHLYQCTAERHTEDRSLHDVDEAQIDVPEVTKAVSCEEKFLSTEELYHHLVISNRALSISQLGEFLIMSEYDVKYETLSKNEYVIVQRRAFCFADGTNAWVTWCCGCSQDGNHFRTLNSHVEIQLEEMPSSICLHTTVAELIYERFDSVHEVVPMIETVGSNEHDYSGSQSEIGREICEVQLADKLFGFCITSGNNPGLMTLKCGVIFCMTCKKNYCVHAIYCNELKMNNSELLPEVLCDTEDKLAAAARIPIRKLSYRVFSLTKIPFNTNESTSAVLRKLSQIAQVNVLCPKISLCECDGTTFNETVIYAAADIITMTSISKVQVFCKKCTSCSKCEYYDGQEDGLLNMGTYLVGHDIMRNYMHSFLHGRRPMHTFHQVLCDVFIDYGYGEVGRVLPYEKFKIAWYSYMNLLDIDITDGFMCDICTSQPDIVVCDGTSLAFQKRMWSWQHSEQVIGDVTNVQIRFHERIFIANVQLRKYLKRFAIGSKTVNGKRFEILSAAEKEHMMREALKMSTALSEFLLYVNDECNMVAPTAVKDLLLSMASTSPVSSYLHVKPSVKALLDDIVVGINIKEVPEKWKALRAEIPVLFNILAVPSVTTIPLPLVNLLHELWIKAEGTFSCAQQIQQSSDGTGILIDDHFAHFPRLRKVRNRGLFAADVSRSFKGSISCKKTHSGHPTLLPGIFTIYCPHGICYGFQVMQRHESPDVPFTIFRTRFATAPRVVVYDNACALHNYVLNRDPHFFRHTEFYVDRLHWDNHTGCSSGYCLANYADLSHINSQANEQGNAGLQRIKDQLSYMTAENFMKHCSFYLWNKNRLKKQLIA